VTARVPSPSLRLGVLLGAVLVVALALPLVLATGLGDRTPPISITVDGRAVAIETGSRLAAVQRSLGLHPRDGALLDVHGHALDRHADPGRILVNGRPATPRTVLAAGDSIQVVDGVDRTERTRRVRTSLGRSYGDPQFSLATAPMLRIDTVGRVSGIVVATAYRPIGAVRTPRAVALTFDDGPWPGSTRAVLNVLERMHAKATFFVIGYLAKRHPDLIRAELHAGMAVGSHSWDHPEPFDAIPVRRMRTELATTSDYLHNEFGLRAALFRPPGGSEAPDVVTQASLLGMRVVNWDVDPRDWSRTVSTRDLVRAVLSNVRRGAIVDLHDGGGDRSATVKALPSIIRGIRRRGLRLVVLR
jgi:peptidoglycan/xylan/chitin deacetylase (PgdA/CDA1 family)/sulfur carrier protein ThiS